jgi:uncharacterized protein (TIGR03437 family)
MSIRFPLLAWATCCIGLGALRVDHIIQVPLTTQQTLSSISTDSAGNLIVTGFGAGGFVTKLDPAGNIIFKFSNFGAYGAAAVSDGNNDVYWVGSGGAPGFPFPFTKRVLPVDDLGSYVPGFVVKFRGTDGTILWAAEIDALQPHAITVDAHGMITVAGFANTAPAATTEGAYRSPNAGSVNALGIVRLTPEGDAVFMAAYGGQSVNGTRTCVSGAWFECLSDPRTTPASILLDGEGNIWVAGSTNEIDLPVTSNAIRRSCGCSLYSGDGFLAELSPDGSRLLYSTYLGSSAQSETDQAGDDAIVSAVMDDSGHIWLGGSTSGTDLPVTGDAFQSTLQGDTDGFVMEYDPVSNKILYSTYYGTQGTNAVDGITIDSRGRAVTAGYVNSNRQNPYSIGSDFVAVLTGSGFEIMPMLRYGSDAGIVRSPSDSLVVAGRGSVIAYVQDSDNQAPSVFGIGNTASLKANGQVSPGEMVSIVGTGLGPDTPVTASLTDGRFASEVGGVRVLFDDLPAPLLYVSRDEVRAIVPFGLGSRQEVMLVVENAGMQSHANRLGVISAVPAVFLTQMMNKYLPVAAALNADGSVNSPSNPAAPGSVISIFGTGFGGLTPSPADGTTLSGSQFALQQAVQIFGTGFVPNLYAGPAPGQVAGVMQVNFRLPDVVDDPPTILLYAGPWPADFFSVWVTGS